MPSRFATLVAPPGQLAGPDRIEGPLRKLLVLAIFVVVLVGLDAGARLAVEAQLADRLEAKVPEAGSAEVSVSSFPFLVRLLASGQVARVRASVTDLRAEDLRFSIVAVDLRDVRINRDALLFDRVVDFESVGRGTAVAELTQSELSEALGVPIVLEPGRVGVRIGGRTVEVSVALRDGVLVVSGASVPLPRLSMPGLPLVRCQPAAEVLEDLLRLSCAVDQVPDELLREAQRRLATA